MIFILCVDTYYLSGKVHPAQAQHVRNHEEGTVPVEHQYGALGDTRTESRQSNDSLVDLISRLNRVLAKNPLQDFDGSAVTAPPKYENM